MEVKGDIEKMDMYRRFSEPPKWMDREYVLNVLRSSENDPKLELLDFQIVSATKPGDNFASIALRLKAKYLSHGRETDKSYIVKVEEYTDMGRKEMMADSLFFETESSMYMKTLAEMHRLIKSVDPLEVIAPPCGFYSLQPNKVIFIEDISPEFQMKPNTLGFEQSQQMFKKLATFHALSFFMGESHEPMKDYNQGFISKATEKMLPMFLGLFKNFAETISEWPEMEVVAEKIDALIPNIYPRLLEIFKKNEITGYNVLNHGDFHIKNIMFRNQNDFPNELDPIRLIDFQLCIWASPSIDISFALLGMCNQEARDRRPELIQLYHEHFVKTLSGLGFMGKVPSLLDLNIELMRNGLVELIWKA